jgi:hypothetical protein
MSLWKTLKTLDRRIYEYITKRNSDVDEGVQAVEEFTQTALERLRDPEPRRSGGISVSSHARTIAGTYGKQFQRRAGTTDVYITTSDRSVGDTNLTRDELRNEIFKYLREQGVDV